MCGICGIYDRSGASVDTESVYRMCDVLRHRGPEDQGAFVKGSIGLGMRRLSVIDLETGHQPIGNEDGSVQVVLNGEIYNYIEIRRALSEKGHRFTTESDTEVIVHAYEQWGPKCVRHFRGMFGFALWDARLRTLFLARDPLGIKPLFYRNTPGQPFLFGSEIKALLEAPVARPSLSSRAVNEYFARGFVHAPNSIYADVGKLRPGEYALVDARGIRFERYWCIMPRGRPCDMDEEEAVERVLAELRESVRLQLRSDVPVGAFHSGGVDSSTVVALLSEVSPKPVRTFSIGFAEASHDESPYAREVARRFGTEHTEFIVEPGHAREVLPKLAWHFDEPFADSSAIPTYYLSEMTREHVTVALSGDGADELFAGYPQFVNEQMVQLYRLLPASVRRDLVGRLVRGLPPDGLPIRFESFVRRLRKVYDDAQLGSSFERYFRKSVIREPIRRRIYTKDFSRHVSFEDESALLVNEHFGDRSHGHPIADLLDVMTSVQLPDDMLTKVDRASMAHSLEVRVPFLDHRFVELAAALPVGLKLRRLTSKYLLKKALCRYLPRQLVYRKKQGFAVPLGAWLRGSLSQLTYQSLQDSGVFKEGVLEPSGVKALLGEHKDGRCDHTTILYSMLFFAFWFDTWRR